MISNKHGATLGVAGGLVAVIGVTLAMIAWEPTQPRAAETVSVQSGSPAVVRPALDVVRPAMAVEPAQGTMANASACGGQKWPYVGHCEGAAAPTPTRQVRVIAIDRSAPATVTIVGEAPKPLVLPVVAAVAPDAVLPTANAQESNKKAARKQQAKRKEARSPKPGVIVSGDTYTVRRVALD